MNSIRLGYQTIDISSLEQFVELGQVRAVADAIVYGREKYADGKRTIAEIVALISRDWDESAGAMDVLGRGRLLGSYARPRIFELAATINRLRTLKVTQK